MNSVILTLTVVAMAAFGEQPSQTQDDTHVRLSFHFLAATGRVQQGRPILVNVSATARRNGGVIASELPSVPASCEVSLHQVVGDQRVATFERINQPTMIPREAWQLFGLTGDVAAGLMEGEYLIRAFRCGSRPIPPLRLAIEKAGHAFDTALYLGYVDVETGNCSTALTHFMEAVRLNPASDEAVGALADCHERLGNTGEAIRLYRRASQLFDISPKPQGATRNPYAEKLHALQRRSPPAKNE